ncbi:mannose-1-phosphate guanylyltransferase [Chitinophaga skermanii]|uniref:mannose-1-phosphate guanylyltransferase n=1 Tax=Chitinophaga skermanii TaxID=331697 RepID=A0A327R392_9BACT|nr:mannose-1-phosphate guanylyltransferase [Chitinophaga skermanii]RAJ10528.1 mannose-1-phosphate guanylyltransferase [Chitinophaga skermanii]
MKSTNDTYVFIMAGGVGSRFWPKSRNNYPKQFIDILGVGQSLLQLTYARFEKLCSHKNIFIVTNNQYKDLVAEQLPSLPAENILCEPSRNNTAPCIAYATFKLAGLNPNATMVIAPSDHFILKEDVFVEKIQQAVNFASKNEVLVTLGIQPTRPDTGYGYINYDRTPTEDGVFKVTRFMEKPPLAKAIEFLESGDYVWNAGIFVWQTQAALNAFETYAGDIFKLFQAGLPFYNTGEEQKFINEHYPNSPNISIDFAIMEKANNVFTIPAEFGWSDLGTWASLYDNAHKEGNNNVINTKLSKLDDTENSIINVPKDKLVVVNGLKDYIVVDNEDVLLIYPKHKEQDIKKVTEELKNEGKETFL